MKGEDYIKIVVVLVLFCLLGYMINSFLKKNIAAASKAGDAIFKTSSPVQHIVGGDKDEYGCIGSAGYTWCEDLQKCIRPWEETCSSK